MFELERTRCVCEKKQDGKVNLKRNSTEADAKYLYVILTYHILNCALYDCINLYKKYTTVNCNNSHCVFFFLF